MVVFDLFILHYLNIIKWLVLQNLWFWIFTCCKYQFFFETKDCCSGLTFWQMSHIYKKEKCRSMKREMQKHENEKCKRQVNLIGRAKFGNDINLLYQDIASLKWAIPHFKKANSFFLILLTYTGLALVVIAYARHFVCSCRAYKKAP